MAARPRAIDAPAVGPDVREHDLRDGTVDAALWFFGSLLILSIIPIGFVSGDGLALIGRISNATWSWNPNHLLVEPLAALWHTLVVRLDLSRSAPDRLKLLSITSGAVAIALFRIGVAGRVAVGRFAANHATAWLAFGSAFSRLWISEEPHMLQMPFVVLTGAFVVAYHARRTSGRAALVGLSAGIAAVFFVSNILLALCLALALSSDLVRTSYRRALAHASAAVSSAFAVSGAAMYTVWSLVPTGDTGFLEWLTSYGGAQDSVRTSQTFGTIPTLAGLTLGLLRALYGAGSSLVDLGPIVEAYRDSRPVSLWIGLNALAFCAIAVLLLILLRRAVRESDPVRRCAVSTIVAGFTVAILGFGTFWNNSDDQFYFQLALPVATLVAVLPVMERRSVLALALSAFALSWNLRDLTKNYISYPRAERTAALRSGISGADLVIYPGNDEVGHLLYFVDSPSRGQQLSITSLAEQYPAESGLEQLKTRVRDVILRGGRVDVIQIFDLDTEARQPWYALYGLGYARPRIMDVLATFPVTDTSRNAGPFTIRSIGPLPLRVNDSR